MKIPPNPIKTSIAKIRSTAVFQRINNARMRQDERMTRWVEKKLFPRPTQQQIDPPRPESPPVLVKEQIHELLSSAAKLKEEAESISESSGDSGININELIDSLISFASQLNSDLGNMDAKETAAHLNSRLMQYELQTLQQLAKGVCWAISAKYSESIAQAKAADIAAQAKAILDQMPQAPIDIAYIAKDVDLKESETSTSTSTDDNRLTPSELAKKQADDRLTAANNLETIFSVSAPYYSRGYDFVVAKEEEWQLRRSGEDHVPFATDLHSACLRFRIEVITCVKKMEADPLIRKYERTSLDTLKGNIEFATSTIDLLERYLGAPARESSNDESGRGIHRSESIGGQSLDRDCGSESGSHSTGRKSFDNSRSESSSESSRV